MRTGRLKILRGVVLTGVLATIALFQNCDRAGFRSMSFESSSVAQGVGPVIVGPAAPDDVPNAPPNPTPTPITPTPAPVPTASGWKPLAIGAGGWLTGIDISPDGQTMVVRADTYGAYVRDVVTGAWIQLVTSESMPGVTPNLIYNGNRGVFEIRVAPSDSRRLYMAIYGRVYRSDDRGGRWTATAFPTSTMEANADRRIYGQKMAVDPLDPNVLYVGTEDKGVLVTTDGGATFARVGDVPVVTGSGAYAGIAFSPVDRAPRTRSQVIVVGTGGMGTYVSRDAGRTFSRADGGPRATNHGKFAVDGNYYASGDDGSKLFRLNDSRWTDVTPPGGSAVVVTDPFDAARLISVEYSGRLNVSPDRGATWRGQMNAVTRVASDIPWLAWTEESYMSAGGLLLDPLTPGRLWFSQGIGVWSTNLAANAGGSTAVEWRSVSLGIEQLVANQIVSPPGGRPLVASWDRPVFRVEDPDKFPSQHGPNREHAISMGWSVDYSASSPNFVALLANWSGFGDVRESSSYSTDGGRTWAKFAAVPAPARTGTMGGSMAVNSPTNIMWVPSGAADPFVTTDGGRSWRVPTGLPAAATAEWHWAYYLKRQIVAADRVIRGTFYLYSHRQGLWRSTDEGQTFAKMSDPPNGSTTYNTTLAAVPGRAGHLFLTGGPAGGEGDTHPITYNVLAHSTDGGATWREIANAYEISAIGFGRARAEGGYPAIYVVGFVNGQFGAYRSEDEGVSWVSLGRYPRNSLDQVVTISGDANEFGTVYVGFSGSGFAYRKVQ